jgi:hypothetical protein
MNTQYTTDHHNTVGGTLGGTLLVIFNLPPEEVSKTAILAATGASVSFLVSYILTSVTKKFKGRRKGNAKNDPPQ